MPRCSLCERIEAGTLFESADRGWTFLTLQTHTGTKYRVACPEHENAEIVEDLREILKGQAGKLGPVKIETKKGRR